ncbi:NUDIX hydrolase [Cupriavidus basilensis]
MKLRSIRPNPVLHPRLDDDGKPVKINEPSIASAPETWADLAAIALWTPDSATPAELHGVPFAPWFDHPVTAAGWDYVDGQMDDLDEPAMQTNGKKPAAGVIVEEPDGRVWVVHPVQWLPQATAPPSRRGHADDGLSLQAAAIKEAFEESGLKVAIVGLIGDVERTQTMTLLPRAARRRHAGGHGLGNAGRRTGACRRGGRLREPGRRSHRG